MKINDTKTKSMICNNRTKWDVLPVLNIGTGNNIEVVEKLKVVGFILQSDMKIYSNTKFIVSEAYARMWILRCLKILGANDKELIDILWKQILSVLLLGVPAWFCMLTKGERSDLNRVLKCALYIIYGSRYASFKLACRKSGIDPVTEQMAKMTEKFAIK